MSNINNEYQYIFYQLCDGQQNLGGVDAIRLTGNENIVLDLRKAIFDAEELQCRPRDLRLYEWGTTVEDYKSNQDMQMLEIDLPLGDPRIQQATKAKPLLVVVPSASPLQTVGNANMPPHLQEQLKTFLHDFSATKETITISNATMNGTRSLMGKMGLRENGVTWPDTPLLPAQHVDGFAWDEGAEDSKSNRVEYMRYLKTTLRLPEKYVLVDTQPNRSLLSLGENNEMVEGVRLKGTTDVVITKSANAATDTIRNNIQALFELKKPANMQKDHTPQTICEHFAASFLNSQHPIVSVLTDLNENWTFFWFAFSGDDNDDNDDSKNSDDVSEMAVYRLCLRGEDAATKAIHLLGSLFDNSDSGKLPSTFAKRQPFQAVVNCLASSAKKRSREVDGGDSDSQDRHSKPPPSSGADHIRSSPNGQGANSSTRSGRPSQNSLGDGCQGGGSNQSIADSLSLLVSPSFPDVGNELDLLDMVDESEQYEIIRSFAARHIVPYMRGPQV